MPNITLTPGTNIGLTPRKLRQTLGGQGGQEITAYIPDPIRFTGIAGTEYAQGSAPNLQYVADTIYKQYKDAQGNLFELVPSQNPAGLSDPGTYLRQLSGTPQGYAQTPQDILRTSRNLPQGWEQDIYGAVKKTEYLNILPGETEQAYYKRTGIGYSPAFGGQMPQPVVPTAQSIQQGIDKLLKDIQTTGIGKPGDVNYLAPGRLATTPTGQITPTITAEGLQGGGNKAIDISGTTPTATGDAAGAAVAGIMAGSKSFADFYKEFTPPETETDKLYKDLVAKYSTEIEELKGRGEYQLAQEKAQEVQAKKEAMRANQAKIDALNAEFEKYSMDVQGKPITMASITGDIAAKRNAIAGQMLMLQASQLALTNQYNDAVATANRAVDLKYSDAKDAIEIRKAQIDIIKDQLTSQQKKYADAMTAYLNQQKDLINQQQTQETNKNNAVLSIMKDYPDAGWTEIPATVAEATSLVQKNSAKYKKEIATGTTETSDQKAIKYDAVKQRAKQLFADGATKEEYQQMRQELIDGGLGSYLDDFDKFAQPYLPAEPISLDKVKSKVIETLTPQKGILTRDEGRTMAKNELFTALKLETGQTLPESYNKAIEDALNEVYGAPPSMWNPLNWF